MFEHYHRLVVSINFVNSQRRREAFLLHGPDLVIVDEAHDCARPAGQSAAQQQRHQLPADLAKAESRHLILVTATPHRGIEEPLLSLLGFINPTFEKLDLEKIERGEREELARHFAGFQGTIGSEKWLEKEEAELLFENVEPSGNLSDGERKNIGRQLC